MAEWSKKQWKQYFEYLDNHKKYLKEQREEMEKNVSFKVIDVHFPEEE